MSISMNRMHICIIHRYAQMKYLPHRFAKQQPRTGDHHINHVFWCCCSTVITGIGTLGGYLVSWQHSLVTWVAFQSGCVQRMYMNKGTPLYTPAHETVGWLVATNLGPTARANHQAHSTFGVLCGRFLTQTTCFVTATKPTGISSRFEPHLTSCQVPEIYVVPCQ